MYNIKKFKPSLNYNVGFMNNVLFNYSVSNKYVDICYIMAHTNTRCASSIEFKYQFYKKVYDQCNYLHNDIKNKIILHINYKNKATLQFITRNIKISLRNIIYIKLNRTPFSITLNNLDDMLKNNGNVKYKISYN